MKFFLSILFSVFITTTFYSQNTIWGTVKNGGLYGSGYIYRTDSVGNNLTIAHHFNRTIDGREPGPIIQASNGKLYGMTFSGGQYVIFLGGPFGTDSTQGGTLFEYDPILDSLKTLKHFNSTDAQYPAGFDGPSKMRILEVSAGNLWCVFNVTKNNIAVSQSLPRYIINYNISTSVMTPGAMIPSWTTPAYPGSTAYTSYTGELYKSSNGFVYGTTAGYSACALTTDATNGSVIRINPTNNAFSFIRPFPCSYADGWLPESNLAEANGKFYGSTRWGGSAISLPFNHGDGVIFEYDPVGNTYTRKYDFPGGISGGYPLGYMVKANNGKLYGTSNGGTPYANYPNGSGIIYEYDPITNVYSKKYDFIENTSLMDVGIIGSIWLKSTKNGKLYGTTQLGLFEYNTVTNQTRPAGRFNTFLYPNPIIELCRKPAYKLKAPYNYTICANSFFTYDLNCDNATTISWKLNGTAISTQTTSTLQFNQIALTDAGTWVCEMTNDCGITTSPTLTLVVNPSGVGVITSTLSPLGTTSICPNSTITLSGNTNGIWNTEATSSSITISNPGTYQVVNTNTCGSTFSNIITIDTISSPYKPIITFTTAPGNLLLNPSICIGDSMLLTGNTNGIWNTGETNSTIYVKDTLKHYAISTNGCKSVTSDTAKASYYPVVQPPVININGTQQICSGDSVLLTTSGFPQITWYSVINNNLNFAGSGTSYYAKQTGDYYVTFNAFCGPVYSQTVHINADTLALDTAIVTPLSSLIFCQGGNVVLQSNNSNCVWSTGETTQTISATYNGQYYVINHNSCSSFTSALINVTVTPAPTINYTEPLVPVCLTTPAFTLAVATPTGGNYSGTGVTGNTFNPAIAGSGTHTISYSYYDATLGCTGQATQSITIDYNPSILAGGSTTICQGNNVLLIQTVTPYGTWNTGQTGQILSVNQAGDYFVTQNNNCGITVNSNTITTTLIPAPTQPTITQIGTNLVASSGGVTTQWYFNGGLIPGAFSPTYTPTQNGNYTVLISNMNGCYSMSAIYTFLNTGIYNMVSENDNITIFPNPCVDNFTMTIPLSESKITITNAIGQIVYQKSYKNEKEIYLQLNQSGIYVVEISSEKGVYTKKLVVNTQ